MNADIIIKSLGETGTRSITVIDNRELLIIEDRALKGMIEISCSVSDCLVKLTSEESNLIEAEWMGIEFVGSSFEMTETRHEFHDYVYSYEIRLVRKDK